MINCVKKNHVFQIPLWLLLTVLMSASINCSTSWRYGRVHEAGLATATKTVTQQELEMLRLAAEQAHSSALLVMQGGNIIEENYFNQPPRIQSLQGITASVAALVLGSVVGSENMPTIDEPVYRYYPEWKQGQKKHITVRHLLEQTSGLQSTLMGEDGEIDAHNDVVKVALAADVDTAAGTKVWFSNKATNLLAGIVEKASGHKLDDLARTVLFKPLGITQWTWQRDKAGNPMVSGGLAMRARDVAKIGQLMVQKGMWQHQQIIPATWIQAMAEPSSVSDGMGLSWWLLKPCYNHCEQSKTFPLILKSEGYLGQKLYVFPAQNLVMVRLSDTSSQAKPANIGFEELDTMVIEWAKKL